MTSLSNRLALSFMAVNLMAASPKPNLSLEVPEHGSSLPLPAAPAPRPQFQPAPLPNRDVELAAPRASDGPSVAPNLFTRSDQYRGDGFARGSTAQTEQEKRVKPGAGLSLHMPFSPN